MHKQSFQHLLADSIWFYMLVSWLRVNCYVPFKCCLILVLMHKNLSFRCFLASYVLWLFSLRFSFCCWRLFNQLFQAPGWILYLCFLTAWYFTRWSLSIKLVKVGKERWKKNSYVFNIKRYWKKIKSRNQSQAWSEF